MPEHDDPNVYAELNRRCETHMEHINEILHEIKATLYGNGKDGLKTVVLNHSFELEQIRKERETMRKLFYGILSTLVATLIVAVVSQFIAMSRASTIAEVSSRAVAQSNEMMKEIKTEISKANMRGEP